jgi:uncharacterized protein YdeI (YjbR/CyaY-like superfamily)
VVGDARAQYASRVSDPREVECTTIAQWASWLKINSSSASGVWLVSHKKSSPQPTIDYDDMVCEALCWGWVDSRVGRVDEHRTKTYFSARRSASAWSASNKSRIDRLIGEGRMQPAGLAIVEDARRSGAWTALDVANSLEIPDDLLAGFRRFPGSKRNFEAFSRSNRRMILEWILLARRPETRATRIQTTAEMAARDEVANLRREKN